MFVCLFHGRERQKGLSGCGQADGKGGGGVIQGGGGLFPKGEAGESSAAIVCRAGELGNGVASGKAREGDASGHFV